MDDKQPEAQIENKEQKKPVEKQMVQSYPIPQEVLDLFINGDKLMTLRITHAKEHGGYRKAVKLTKKGSKLVEKFWKKTTNIYPELKGQQLLVLVAQKCVVVKPRPGFPQGMQGIQRLENIKYVFGRCGVEILKVEHAI